MKSLETLFHVLDTEPQKIEDWFAKQWQGLSPLPYFSCDIRHADYKIGIVDTNLFSAGFNNLCSSFSNKVSEAFSEYFEVYFPDAKTIAILAENHTRNKFYLLNVLHLQSLIEKTGRTCFVTMIADHFPQDKIEIALTENQTLTLFEPQFENNHLTLNQHKIDLVISNNDFSSILPESWQNLATPMVPETDMGWLKRTKSKHFDILKDLTQKLANEFQFDPWQILPDHNVVKNISSDNLEMLAESVDSLLVRVQKKYDEYGISETPYCFIKNDSGTYGLGIVTASSGKELLDLNRKKRNKLFSAKGDSSTSQFLIQEGVPTVDSYSGFPIEPVIYGVGKNPVAGFFRFHEGKDAYESLNSPGMSFSCLCLHKLNEPHESDFINCKSKRELVNGSMFLARLAALAAAIERKA